MKADPPETEMSTTAIKPAMPDHTQLPFEDGTFMMNFQEGRRSRACSPTPWNHISPGFIPTATTV